MKENADGWENLSGPVPFDLTGMGCFDYNKCHRKYDFCRTGPQKAAAVLAAAE